MAKYLDVTMPDGSVWRVPADVVADDRANYYAGEDGDTTYDSEFALVLQDDGELMDWAKNNLNWEAVAPHATRIFTQVPPVDYQEGWVNGPMEVVEVE